MELAIREELSRRRKQKIFGDPKWSYNPNGACYKNRVISQQKLRKYENENKTEKLIAFIHLFKCTIFTLEAFRCTGF